MRIEGLRSIHGQFFDTINIIQADCSQKTLEAAMERCAYFHALLNRFDESSDIGRINGAKGRPTRVSPHTIVLLTAGIGISEQSGGAFNLCIGPLTRLWDFKSATPRIPNREEVDIARGLCDWHAVHIEDDTVTLPEGMDIDVGGIAKGYITDQVAAFLRAEGVEHALLNFGGNIVAIGPRPDGEPWRIGLQTPGGEIGRAHWGVVSIQDESIVTSATYARHFEIDGEHYHHILDPRTGYPVKNKLHAVTARGKESLFADGVSTACFVMGAQEGANLAAGYGIETAFLTEEYRVQYTQGMQLILT